MARPKKELGLGDPTKIVSSYEADAAASINEAVDRARASSSYSPESGFEDSNVTLPNGSTRKLSETLSLIDHDYLHEDNKSIYADPHDYMEHVKPGHMYAWASFKDPGTLAKIRSGLYRAVDIEEIRSDSKTPIDVKEKAGQKFVCVGDVVLVEISPRGVSRLYGNPAAQAVMRTARNQSFENLKRNLHNASNGLVTAEMDAVNE